MNGWPIGAFIDLLNSDRSYESISGSRNCLDKQRTIGRIAERLAQSFDGIIQSVVEINEGVGGPEPLSKFFSRHQLARAFEERLKNRERLILKVNFVTVLSKTLEYTLLDGSRSSVNQKENVWH